MAEEIEYSQGKSLNDLGNDALWFLIHSAIAIVTMLIMVGIVSLFHPDADATGPKLLGTLFAFLLPLIVGAIVARRWNGELATYVWIAGILVFVIACVWVMDLPTGEGLCEKCGLYERLWRTFFSIQNGSGLIAGNGLLVGSWTPLALFGYSIGARYGLSSM